MNKRLLTEMTDEELMELERLLIRSEAALRQTKPMTEEEIDEEIATNEHYCERSFAEGVRWAERKHEIGESNDTRTPDE